MNFELRLRQMARIEVNYNLGAFCVVAGGVEAF